MSKIRNTLLAHKQEPGFFDAFQAVDHITRSSISELLSFMAGLTHGIDPHLVALKMHDSGISKRFKSLVRAILAQYANDELDGFRVTNYTWKSAARDRTELVTGDKAALREQLEAGPGERIAALEAVKSRQSKGVPGGAGGRTGGG